MKNQSSPATFTLIITTVISGLLWYFAIAIHGKYGFLLWVAPIPILWISLQSSARTSFVCAFLAYLIGQLSWVSYLLALMPLVSVIIVTVLPSVLAGLYILLHRWIVLKSKSAWSVLAFPAIVTAFEFLIFTNQTNGTAGSLAYTQSNYLTMIQIASVTGIWGIPFVASLLPAALVLAWYFKGNRNKQLLAGAVAGFILMSVITFGAMRLNGNKPHTNMAVGMTVVSENLYTDAVGADSAKQQIVGNYLEQITSLADQGAEYILFPEKIIQIQASRKDSLLSVFKAVAAQTQSTVIGGLTVKQDSSRQNLVEFISPSGDVQEYQKRFHVMGFEGDFEPGNKVGRILDIPFAGGMAICKDLDFPLWLRKYQDVDLLFVPAWDFVQDGWLHSRMAILRGIENGYTIVRAARQGRLTVSDYRGNIVAEVNTEQGTAESLLAQAPVYHVDTIYSKWGDWFGWVCIFLAAAFVAQAFIISRRQIR